MRKNYRTSFEDEEGYPIASHKITGFVHKCRKAILQYCFCCMKDIVKGEQYIDFYSEIMGKERVHLKCFDFNKDGQWLAIKRKYKRVWVVKLFTNQIVAQ